MENIELDKQIVPSSSKYVLACEGKLLQLSVIRPDARVDEKDLIQDDSMIEPAIIAADNYLQTRKVKLRPPKLAILDLARDKSKQGGSGSKSRRVSIFNHLNLDLGFRIT